MIRICLVFFLSVFSTVLIAQELSDKQRELANQYVKFEQILYRLAETMGATDSQQITLLKNTLLESKNKLLARRLQTLAYTLQQRQFTEAANEQSAIEKELIQLLKLFESGNRNESREKEKEQIKRFLEDLENLLHSERSLKNQTQTSDLPNVPMLEKRQQDIRVQTQAFENRLAEHESAGDQTAQSIQNAIERMKFAEQKLHDAEKSGALEDQEDAIAQLQRIKEELEHILRQIREEELMQTLENLDERLLRMLQQEQTLRSQTEKLEKDSQSQPDPRQIKIRSDRLANDQHTVIENAESTLLILREDGTAQAMVESLLQALYDMNAVKTRLNQTIADAVTVHLEDSVIDSLQEMHEAVQTAKKESKERQEQPDGQSASGSEAGKEPLIQMLAELRMIRSMQRRVNERTKRCDEEIQKMLELQNPNLNAMKQMIEELARQQNRISRILYEIKIGKTQ